MARKPVHLRPAGHLDARDAAWAVIRRKQQFTLDDLEIATGEHRETLATYVRALEKGAYIVHIGHDAPTRRGQRSNTSLNHKKLYKLINDVGVEAPRLKRDGTPVTQGRGRENMWTAIRILDDFDFHELAEEASVDDVDVGPREACEYVRHLRKAGYLSIVQKSKPGRATRYRLLPGKFTGPKPPMIQRIKQVFDPNLGEVVWSQEVRP